MKRGYIAQLRARRDRMEDRFELWFLLANIFLCWCAVGYIEGGNDLSWQFWAGLGCYIPCVLAIMRRLERRG